MYLERIQSICLHLSVLIVIFTLEKGRSYKEPILYCKEGGLIDLGDAIFFSITLHKTECFLSAFEGLFERYLAI